MLSWILQISIASICFIFLVHHLIYFLKNTLTIPKTKDLVTCSSEKYNKMYSILETKTQDDNISNVIELTNCTSIDSLPLASDTNMKDELKNFLKNHLQDNEVANTNTNYSIENFDISNASGNGGIQYSMI